MRNINSGESDFDKKLATGELFDKYGVLLEKNYFGDAIVSTEGGNVGCDVGVNVWV